MNKVALVYCFWDNVKPKTVFEAMQLTSSGLFSFAFASIGSLLPLTRNHAVCTLFNEFPDFTHILFVDGDMAQVSPDLISSLIKADKDIISPVMTRREPPFSPCFSEHDYPKLFKELEKPQIDRVPVEVDLTGLGCTLIKRCVLESIEEKIDEKQRLWFTTDRYPREKFWEETAKEEESLNGVTPKAAFLRGIKLGLNAHKNTIFYGEDFDFCKKAKSRGYKIWIHAGLYVSHIGDCTYNFRDFLDYIEWKEKYEMDSRLEQKVSIWNCEVKSGKYS